MDGNGMVKNNVYIVDCDYMKNENKNGRTGRERNGWDRTGLDWTGKDWNGGEIIE